MALRFLQGADSPFSIQSSNPLPPSTIELSPSPHSLGSSLRFASLQATSYSATGIEDSFAAHLCRAELITGFSYVLGPLLLDASKDSI
ncbi:hypothetical protein BDFG_06473 [Blastomyces dermatitidis ATCC 26199]|nr:hypothetical protein BDFG_06473 [Blastomyces dermatitidis ATCC 26199]